MTSRVKKNLAPLCRALRRSIIFPDSLEENETDTSKHTSSGAFLEVSVRYHFPAWAQGKRIQTLRASLVNLTFLSILLLFCRCLFGIVFLHRLGKN